MDNSSKWYELVSGKGADRIYRHLGNGRLFRFRTKSNGKKIMIPI